MRVPSGDHTGERGPRKTPWAMETDATCVMKRDPEPSTPIVPICGDPFSSATKTTWRPSGDTFSEYASSGMPCRSRVVPSSPTIIGCCVGGSVDCDRVAGSLPLPDGRVTANTSASAAMIAAAVTNAPSLRLRAARRCLAPCRSRAPGSGRTFSIAERSTSRASGIPRLLCSSQRSPAFGRESSHGRGPNTQDLRRLIRWVSEQIHEHESRPLALREPEEEPPHIGTHVRIEERVTALRDRSDLPERHRRPTATRPEPVERDPEQVCGRVIDPMDHIPPLPELQERVLHQLLRVAAVPGHQVEGLEEALVFPLEQRAERSE